MSRFIQYLRDYFRGTFLKSFVFTIIFLAPLVLLNYSLGIEARLHSLHPWPLSLLGFFLFYAFVYLFVWGIQYGFGVTSFLPPEENIGKSFFLPSGESFRMNLGKFFPIREKPFLLLLLSGPLFFACKILHWDLSFLYPERLAYPWNRYIPIILQYPAKLSGLLVLLFAYCMATGKGDRSYCHKSFFGLTIRNTSPYLLLLACLVPLVALAATRHDFLQVYPKVKNVAFINGYTPSAWPWKLLYELSYGLDFMTIELFFRGFLVIGLARYMGEYAILPMAAFYCTIHFGKPLGECISSFFGGLALGVLAWRTRSITGGLIIHLGLAWLMEIAGWLGNSFF